MQLAGSIQQSCLTPAVPRFCAVHSAHASSSRRRRGRARRYMYRPIASRARGGGAAPPGAASASLACTGPAERWCLSPCVRFTGPARAVLLGSSRSEQRGLLSCWLRRAGGFFGYNAGALHWKLAVWSCSVGVAFGLLVRGDAARSAWWGDQLVGWLGKSTGERAAGNRLCSSA